MDLSMIYALALLSQFENSFRLLVDFHWFNFLSYTLSKYMLN